MLNGTALLYPPAKVARSYASQLNAVDQPVQKLILDAINTAINTGLFSATASMSSKTAEDIQKNMNALQQMGYGVALSSTTLTITW